MRCIVRAQSVAFAPLHSSLEVKQMSQQLMKLMIDSKIAILHLTVIQNLLVSLDLG